MHLAARLIGWQWLAQLLSVAAALCGFWLTPCTCVGSALQAAAPPSPVAPYELTVLPPQLIAEASKNWPRPLTVNINGSAVTKYIPQNLWIACRNRSDAKPLHHKAFQLKNANWTFHYQDNLAKDEFMQTHFANTSILWAYNILNPAIGCSRPEIWRLCVLYKYGGMYIDDDANIGAPLDHVVQADDKMILGREVYDFDDRCYEENFPLSNASMNARHGVQRSAQRLFDGKFFFNWAMLSAPGHPWLLKILTHIVTLLKHEFLYDSLIKMSSSDHRGKLLMCATTFPITHVARDEVLAATGSRSDQQQQQQQQGQQGQQGQLGQQQQQGQPGGGGGGGGGIITNGSGPLMRDGDFKLLYDADMKAWYNDHVVPNHWVKTIQKHRAPYLLEYTRDYFSAMLVQSKGRQIHLIVDDMKYGFQDWDTVVALGYDSKHIRHVSQGFLERRPLGDILTAANTSFSKARLKAKLTTVVPGS